MKSRSLTIDFPDDLYDRVRRRAERAGRSVESELVDLVATALPEADELSPELMSDLESLRDLGDESLWQAARSHLAPEAAGQLELLNIKQQREGLTDQEQQTQSGLLHHYERAMLIRAEAAVLLKERGYDVAGLISKG
ncbi:MAG: Arc family DNA-binding protein [Dehalococcoidia bacterium]